MKSTLIFDSAGAPRKFITPMKGLVVILALLPSLLAHSGRSKDIPVTPVTGESWISHLPTKFSDTRMG